MVVIGWLAVSALLVVATGFTARAGWPAPAPRARRGDLGALYMLEAYLVLVVAMAAGFGGVRGLAHRLGFHFTSWRDLTLAPVLWLAALIVGGLLTALLAPLLGHGPSNSVALFGRARDPLFLALTVGTVVLLGPAAEEMLFRGALFGWLRGRTPAAAAAAISAATFAAAHLLPAAFPFLFVFGIAAAIMYERTGSTLNSFAMHACQNAFAVVVTLGLLGGHVG